MSKADRFLLTVLYVEDDPSLRDLVTIMLSKKVERLYTADNGKEGLEAFLTYKPDIIITDINMPLMSGLEMAREIRKIERKAQIIVTTAYNDTEYFLDSIDIGVNQYVLKPIENEALLFSAIERCGNVIMLERKMQQIYRAIEESEEQVIITDVRGLIEYINPMVTESTGYTLEKVKGKRPSECFPALILSDIMVL